MTVTPLEIEVSGRSPGDCRKLRLEAVTPGTVTGGPGVKT
jgi:hypothetical protein